jgi:DNA-binding NarL/FixJ family response regulator
VRIKVFIVDDHGVIRNGLRSLLGDLPDIEVVGYASNGLDALKQVAGSVPDILIADMGMPDGDGIWLTGQVTQKWPDCRVIVLSMHCSGPQLFQALKAGAMGYVLKESAGHEVVDAIRTVHSAQYFLSPKLQEMVIQGYLKHGLDSEEETRLEKLTERERQIFHFVIAGETNVRIGEILSIAPKTVEVYRSRMMRKLGVKDVAGLVKLGIARGLVHLDSFVLHDPAVR